MGDWGGGGAGGCQVSSAIMEQINQHTHPQVSLVPQSMPWWSMKLHPILYSSDPGSEGSLAPTVGN